MGVGRQRKRKGGERVSILGLSQILPMSDHESQSCLSARIKGEKSRAPLSHPHLYPLLTLSLPHLSPILPP